MMLRQWRSHWNSESGPAEVLKMAVPLVLGTCSLTLQLFIDRLFLTWYSDEAIAAVIPAVCALWVVLGPLHGVVNFANTFVAQYQGAGRRDQIGPVVGQAALVGLLGGVAILCLAPSSRPFFEFIGHDPAVREVEITYFRILLLSGAPMLVMTAASSFFGGLGRAWVVLWLNALAAIVNVVLDRVLIFGWGVVPPFGVAGAAWATVIAYAVAALVGLALLWCADADGTFQLRRRNSWRLDPVWVGRLFRFGGPAGLMIMVDVLGWTWFELMVGRLGTQPLAATNVAFNINLIAFMPMLGLSTATQILVGQRLGQNRPDLAQRATWTSFWIAFVFMGTVGLGYVVVPDVFLLPFTLRGATGGDAAWYGSVVVLLRFVAVYTLFDMAALVFSGALRGAGDTQFVMMTTLTTATCVLAVPSYVSIEWAGAGLYTAWCFVTAYVVVLGTIFFLRFQFGPWRDMRLIESGAVADAELSGEPTMAISLSPCIAESQTRTPVET